MHTCIYFMHTVTEQQQSLLGLNVRNAHEHVTKEI